MTPDDTDVDVVRPVTDEPVASDDALDSVLDDIEPLDARVVVTDEPPLSDESLDSVFDDIEPLDAHVVVSDEPPLSDESLDSVLDDIEPLDAVVVNRAYEPISLDFVELYAEHYSHFVRLAALLDPEEPDELIDKAFLSVARRENAPASRSAALLEVRNEMVRLRRIGFRHRRRALISLPDPDEPVIAGLERLPAFQRDSLVLHHYAAMIPEEIATVWHTSPQRVSDHIEFGEATLDAQEAGDTIGVGDRIRHAINADLADFEGEPDVDGFAEMLGRRSRKPALIALAGVGAAAAAVIVAVALWRASPAGEPVIGASRDRDVKERTTTTRSTTSTTRAPTISTLPPNAETTATTGVGSDKPVGTASTRRGPGGGGSNGGGGGGGAARRAIPANPGSGTPAPGTDPAPPPSPPPPPPSPPPPSSAPTTTTTPAPVTFSGGTTSCQANGDTATIGFAGTATPGSSVTVSSSHGPAGPFIADAAGRWSGTATFGGVDTLYDVVSGTISGEGGSAEFSAQIVLGRICS